MSQAPINAIFGRKAQFVALGNNIADRYEVVRLKGVTKTDHRRKKDREGGLEQHLRLEI